MTKTLHDLITSNDFSGYEVSSPAWRLEADQIEEALYGQDGATNLPYDLAETFSERFDLEIISINTWTCTDTKVGLEVLRMQTLPVAVIWCSARKADTKIAFLDEAAFQKVREAWESIKPSPNPDSLFVSEMTLNMPISDPGTPSFDIVTDKSGLPVLSPAGAVSWVQAEGNFHKITHTAALTHVSKILQDSILEAEDFLIQMDHIDPDTKVTLDIPREMEILQNHRSNLIILRQDADRRIKEISEQDSSLQTDSGKIPSRVFKKISFKKVGSSK